MNILTSTIAYDYKLTQSKRTAAQIFQSVRPLLEKCDRSVTEGLLLKMVYMNQIDRDVVYHFYVMIYQYLTSESFAKKILPNWKLDFRQLVVNVMHEIFELCIG
jgi:hypothetical protein